MLWESREALSIGIAMMFFQQFSGINAVIFFQNSIFMEAGISWYNEAAAVTMVVQVTDDRLLAPFSIIIFVFYDTHKCRAMHRFIRLLPTSASDTTDFDTRTAGNVLKECSEA